MKKYFSHLLILINLLIFSLTIAAQTDIAQKTEAEVKIMLCHKWECMSIEIDGQKIPMGASDKGMSLTFHKNGTFTDSEEPTNKETWTYDHKKAVITTGGNPKKILKLTNSELVISSKMDDQIAVVHLKMIE